MDALKKAVLLAAAFVGIGSTLSPSGGAEPNKHVGPDAKQWDKLVDRAIAYLRASQAADGSWSRDASPGVTGVVLTGLLSTGRLSPDDPMAVRALQYIESLVNSKAGHIAGKDPRPQLQNYVTSVNVMALSAANRADRYKKVIGDASEFLKHLQWDEEEGKTPQDDFYGGAGYDSQSRPDMSNTQFFLDALRAAGVPPTDPAFKRALIFVSRCQNLKGEHNDQPWAGKINDGSFIYSAAGGGQTKSDTLPDGGLLGYGSMTYAGIKSMIYCGVPKDDPRIQKAYAWITKHYTVDVNPGMPRDRAQWGLFYYYHTMAKCLSILGVDEVVDASGIKHDWRADITAALAKRQRPDGSWINEKHWMEADPNLVTGYSLMALSYCKPKQ
ncbi:MAG TPA: prenyltransferase/squalene oxidase repeat-containing protein [Gemmataceae bacterium]|nr:prenyltransferase/squalene oxidase repeat-containing protein [Gemmataceae bacterium]